jgi:hypothetical protein
MKNLWVIGFLLVLGSCQLIRPYAGGGGDAYSNYEEDLSGSLPVYPDLNTESFEAVDANSPTSVQSVDGQLDEVQRRLIEKNKSEPYFNGYTVLVFSGIDRDQAFKTQDDLKTYFPDLTPEMQYQQPRYLVKLGKFTYKIEAQKAFSQIKGQFPTARIIQDRFQRKEYTAPSTDQDAPIQD